MLHGRDTALLAEPAPRLGAIQSVDQKDASDLDELPWVWSPHRLQVNNVKTQSWPRFGSG